MGGVTRQVAVGLDLGQASDYTALAITEGLWVPGEDPRFNVRAVKRYPLGTPYPDIVRDQVALFGRPELAGATLVADAGGVGPAVIDMLVEQQLAPVRVKVHGGSEATEVDGEHRIPKRDLVSVLLVAFQRARIHIPKGMPFVGALHKELIDYRLKYNSRGHDSYEAWRESDHDDLVFALGLAVWFLATRGGPRDYHGGAERPASAGIGRAQGARRGSGPLTAGLGRW